MITNTLIGGGKISLPKIAIFKVTLPSVHLIGHPDEEDYIKDGLVFWLDGIDKGGEEGKWVDLVGGVEFTPDAAVAAEWGANYVRGKLTAPVNLPYPAAEFTIELVLNNVKKNHG